MSYMCMVAFALVFQSIPPVLTLIREELNITHAQAGLLMSLFALPGIFVAIPGGVVSDRFGMKKVGVSSLILMIFGTLIVGISRSFLSICLGRLISGMGGLTLAVVLPQLLSQWFRDRELGLGMGVFNTAMPLSTITSLNVFGIIASSFGWSSSVFLTTAVSVLAFLAFLWLFKEPRADKMRSGGQLSSDIAIIGVSMWIVGFTWMWFNAALISFLTFAPDFFASEGYEIGLAGFMSSIVMMGSLFLSPIIGYFVYKFGKEEMFIVLGGVTLALLFILIPSTPFDLALLALIGISAAFVPASIFSLPSKLTRPQNLGLSFGILTACLNIGVLAGPYLTGLAKDLTGGYTASLYIMSVFALIQSATIVLLRLSKARKN